MNLSTCSLFGIDGIAPFLVMHKNAELFPNTIDFRKFYECESGLLQSNSECFTAKAAVKQSPAPTVSIILKSSPIL